MNSYGLGVNPLPFFFDTKFKPRIIKKPHFLPRQAASKNPLISHLFRTRIACSAKNQTLKACKGMVSTNLQNEPDVFAAHI